MPKPARLELFYPVKPLVVNQAFGIYNPAYKRFGFSLHNGIDYAAVSGKHALAMCDGVVKEVGYNDGSGNFVRYRTLGPVTVGDRTGIVEFIYMHAEYTLVGEEQVLKAGDPLMVCDSTGFSTGDHLHISACFVDDRGNRIPIGSPETVECFDFSPYYNRYFAEDAQKLFGLMYQVIALLKKELGL